MVYYILSMTEIKIKPIFNQATPNIWQDFAEVHAATMYATYNVDSGFDNIMDIIRKDAEEWKLRRAKFAFGAYDGDKMVGFIQGYATASRGWVDALYVLHEYQGTGTGGRLLRMAEKSLSPIAKHVELIALPGAMSFYQSRGYTVYGASNHYRKNLKTPPHCEVVPIFSVNAAMAKQFAEINPKFDAKIVNVRHTPVFAYYNVDGRIAGYTTPRDTFVNAGQGLQNIIESSLRAKIANSR